MPHVASPTGISLFYEEYGSGPPLVLVHGSFDNHRTNWARVVEALARRGVRDPHVLRAMRELSNSRPPRTTRVVYQL